eukprot:2099093-Lingulodinium_polyedra.AAC.1
MRALGQLVCAAVETSSSLERVCVPTFAAAPHHQPCRHLVITHLGPIQAQVWHWRGACVAFASHRLQRLACRVWVSVLS